MVAAPAGRARCVDAADLPRTHDKRGRTVADGDQGCGDGIPSPDRVAHEDGKLCVGDGHASGFNPNNVCTCLDRRSQEGVSTSKPMSMLQFCAVTKKYGRRHPALYDVSVRLERGEHTIIIGANGAGKTTFLRLLLGLEEPSAGRIEWQDKPSRIGYAAEEPLLFPRSTPEELFNLWDRQRANTLLRTFELDNVRDSRLAVLSKGERQRVALALAIGTGAGLMILDEPFEGLDPVVRPFVRRVISEALECARESTCIATTHRIEELGAPMKRLLAFNHGRIVKNLLFAELERELELPIAILDERHDWRETVVRLREAGAEFSAHCTIDGRSVVAAGPIRGNCSVGSLRPATLETWAQLWIAPNLLSFTQ